MCYTYEELTDVVESTPIDEFLESLEEDTDEASDDFECYSGCDDPMCPYIH